MRRMQEGECTEAAAGECGLQAWLSWFPSAVSRWPGCRHGCATIDSQAAVAAHDACMRGVHFESPMLEAEQGHVPCAQAAALPGAACCAARARGADGRRAWRYPTC
jgi:hypothetical protein